MVVLDGREFSLYELELGCIMMAFAFRRCSGGYTPSVEMIWHTLLLNA